MPSRHPPGATADRNQAYPPGAGPAIRGAVVVDLRSSSTVDREWAADAPAGADIVLVVEPCQPPPWAALAYLTDNGGHLGLITVQSSDPATITDWVRELQADAR